MVSTFLARNSEANRSVVIKVLRDALAVDPNSRNRFIREAHRASKISHPCVPSIFSVSLLASRTPYIEMEYVDGGTLTDDLRSGGRLETARARQLLMDLASALNAAHKKGIFHRDVKPGNVLVENGSGRVLLTDFGVASVFEASSEVIKQLIRDDKRIREPTYKSPEQLRGEPLTEQTDIYSLGIVVYEALTLHGPYDNADAGNIVSAHQRREPLDLRKLRPDIPGDLREVVMRCLSKIPQDRPRAIDLVALLKSGESSVATATLHSPNVDSPLGVALSYLRTNWRWPVYVLATAVTVAIIGLLIAKLG